MASNIFSTSSRLILIFSGACFISEFNIASMRNESWMGKKYYLARARVCVCCACACACVCVCVCVCVCATGEKTKQTKNTIMLLVELVNAPVASFTFYIQKHFKQLKKLTVYEMK